MPGFNAKLISSNDPNLAEVCGKCFRILAFCHILAVPATNGDNPVIPTWKLRASPAVQVFQFHVLLGSFAIELIKLAVPIVPNVVPTKPVPISNTCPTLGA